MDANIQRCCVQCDNGGAGSLDDKAEACDIEWCVLPLGHDGFHEAPASWMRQS